MFTEMFVSARACEAKENEVGATVETANIMWLALAVLITIFFNTILLFWSIKCLANQTSGHGKCSELNFLERPIELPEMQF